MRRIWMLATLGLVGLATGIFADEVIEGGKGLKRLDARRAMTVYEEAVRKAKAGFDKQVESARKQLLSELDIAQAKATKENQLDEAVKIRDLRKLLEENKNSAPSAKIEIISAFYGQNVSWLDVTEKVREAVKGNREWKMMVNSNDLGDPVPGWGGTRTLLVRYSVGEKIQNKAVYEGKEMALP